MSALRLRKYPPESDNVAEGLAAVLAGSYDVPGLEFGKPPTILDIGAHVGSFSVWAASRWPGAKILAYEPHPESARLAHENAGDVAQVFELAVVGRGRPSAVKLFEGKTNTGQRSIHLGSEQRSDEGVWVETLIASCLVPCDILKIDSEGCELEILADYGHLAGVTCLMLEWHSRSDYEALRDPLGVTKGFELVRDDAKGEWVSDRNLVFLRKR